MVPGIAPISLLLLLQVPGPPFTDCKVISPKNCGFSVKMPGVPKEKTQKIEAIQSPARITIWGIEWDGAAYMVIRTELPLAVIAGGSGYTL
jgi:hypothetical protein